MMIITAYLNSNTASMEAPVDYGVKDTPAYLMVRKDPAEEDSNGPVSVTPDCIGEGSLSSPDDRSDRWLVTLFAPDSAGDHDCKIVIEPKVVA